MLQQFLLFLPGYQKLSWSKVVMDFQIIVEALCQSFFECHNKFSRALRTLCSNAEGFLHALQIVLVCFVKLGV
jgi:hypothetical protein